MDSCSGYGSKSKADKDSDLLETSFEDLRTVVQDRLKKPSAPNCADQKKNGQTDKLVQIYFIYDQRDLDYVEPWETLLFSFGPEILRPIFDGDETEIRECHEENMRACHAVLIYYGAANELWLRRKLRDIQRIEGVGRTEPMRATGILVAPPIRPDKLHFHTHQAIVIPQMNGLSVEAFAPFLLMAGEHQKAQGT